MSLKSLTLLVGRDRQPSIWQILVLQAEHFGLTMSTEEMYSLERSFDDYARLLEVFVDDQVREEFSYLKTRNNKPPHKGMERYIVRIHHASAFGRAVTTDIVPPNTR